MLSRRRFVAATAALAAHPLDATELIDKLLGGNFARVHEEVRG